MKIKLLDKYIFNQVFFTCFGCILIFMIVWIMPEILLKTVQRTISGDYTIEMAVSILLNELPKVLHIALPVGMLLGTILTFEKMSKDFEITVMRSCGFSFPRIIVSAVIISIFAAGFTFLISAKVLPYSSCRLKAIKRMDRIAQFVFPVKRSNGSIEKIIIVPHYDNMNIKDAIVLNFYNEALDGSSLLSGILISDYVKYDYKTWTINSAKKYSISKDGVFNNNGEDVQNVEILNGESSTNAYKLMKYSIHRDRELTNPQISEYIKLLKAEQMDDEYRFMLNKYIQRFVHSFMCILFAILGCLLGFSKPREQKFIGMLIAVGIIFSYYITIPFFDLLAEKAVLLPQIASMIAPSIAIILIIILKKVKDL